MSYEFVVAKKEDLDSLFEIEKMCFPEDYWSKSALEKDFDNEHVFQIVATFQGKPIGYSNFSIVCGEAELNRIAVIPEFRRKKIGDRLLKNTITYCKKEDCMAIYLEVRESNTPAINLYLKSGFEKIGVRNNYYNNPTENAVLMSLNI